MSDRVLATAEARDLIADMRRVIAGGLLADISQLGRDGTRLSQADVWDGPHANEFRGVWAEVDVALTRTHETLVDLNGRIDTITGQIMQAGGTS